MLKRKEAPSQVPLKGVLATPAWDPQKWPKLRGMEAKKELQEFLTSRRNRLQPEDCGLPRGSRRRVPGLRREEVASLAGISLDYYIHIERGNTAGVSDEILTAIAGALQLNPLESNHLFNLARGRSLKHLPPSAQEENREIPASLTHLLQALTTVPAVLISGALDVLAANPLGRAFYQEVFTAEGTPNLASYVFCNPAARLFYQDWEANANDATAILRTELTRSPSPRVQGLVQELHEKSEDFRALWEAHDIISHLQGIKIVNHPQAGQLHMRYEALDVLSLPGTKIFCYTPVSGHTQTATTLAQLRQLAQEAYPQAD